MIRKLRGILDTIETNSVIVDVGGVGYNAFCSSNTLRLLPAKGNIVSLFIETHVREDHIHLYGFATIEEKQAFLQLVKVNGVGSKMALAILSGLTPEQLIIAISAQDKAPLRSVSGVGPKLADRIITELKDKFSTSIGDIETFTSTNNNQRPSSSNISDAISALVNLGYARSDAYLVINKISAQNDNLRIDELIRAGLKELGTR